MHESRPDNISFGLDNPKGFEIAVESLRMHDDDDLLSFFQKQNQA